MPFGPALPKGARTPSTKTTSRRERDMGPPQQVLTDRKEPLRASCPLVTRSTNHSPGRVAARRAGWSPSHPDWGESGTALGIEAASKFTDCGARRVPRDSTAFRQQINRFGAASSSHEGEPRVKTSQQGA